MHTSSSVDLFSLVFFDLQSSMSSDDQCPSLTGVFGLRVFVFHSTKYMLLRENIYRSCHHMFTGFSFRFCAFPTNVHSILYRLFCVFFCVPVSKYPINFYSILIRSLGFNLSKIDNYLVGNNS